MRICLLFLALFLLARLPICLAQKNAASSTLPAHTPTKDRLALVIGNWKYSSRPLVNPQNDARSMKEALTKLGFDVMHYENLSQDGLEDVVLKFTNELKNYRVGLFYFAGHGFQSSQNDNYLMSVDVRSGVNETFARQKSLNLDVVMNSMREAKNPTNLLIIDACRNNPFRSWGRSDATGLGAVNAPEGTIVFFAASPGSEADENPGGQNGLFTQELLKQLMVPNQEINQILRNTSREVKRISERQLPYFAGQMLDDFYLNKTTEMPSQSAAAVAKRTATPAEAAALEALQKQLVVYRKRKYIGLGLAGAALVAGATTYLIVNNKYNNYTDEISRRNQEFSNWYVTNQPGKTPAGADLLSPVSKSQFAGGSLAAVGVAALGSAGLFIWANSNARKYGQTQNKLNKWPNSLSMSPLLQVPQQWVGLAVAAKF